MTTKQPKKIYADFNNCDGEGRVRLNTLGSRESIDQLGPLEEGEQLYLSDNELCVLGRAEYSPSEGIWTATFDWEELDAIVPPSAKGATT